MMLPTRVSIRVFEREEKEMPCHEEHCQHSLKRYGIRADDIHTWIDQPSKKWQGSHRQFRHDTEAVKLAGDIFGKKYGQELAQNIALDHIMADHEEELKQTNESIIMKCSNCGGQLTEQNGKLKCKYCGYEMQGSIATSEAYESTKLPAKTKACVMCRLFKNNAAIDLPKALPPIDLRQYNNVTVDEVYRGFSDKERVWRVLVSLGYRPLSVQDLRDIFTITDSQIKQLLQESRRVTAEEIEKILSYVSHLEPYKLSGRARTISVSISVSSLVILILGAFMLGLGVESLFWCFFGIGFIELLIGMAYMYVDQRKNGILINGRYYQRPQASKTPFAEGEVAKESEETEGEKDESERLGDQFNEKTEAQLRV